MNINTPLSLELQAIIDSQPKACWQNAIFGQDHLPNSLYVEGWVITAHGLPIEHGWLELDSEIIDPTLQDCIKYFPAMRFTSDETVEFLEKVQGVLPLVSFYGRGGMGCAEYKNACLEAFNYLKEEQANE